MEENRHYLKGIIAIVIASFLWGTTGTVASYSTNVSPLAIGAFSMGTAGVLLLLTARYQLLLDARIILSQPTTLLLGALSVAIYPLAFYSSMRLSGIAVGTVVSIATAPFFAATLESLISKRHISKQWKISFFVGAIGIVLLALGKEYGQDDAYSATQQSFGVLLGCLAGLSYASYSWAAKNLIEAGAHSSSAMSSLFGCAALLLLPSLLLTGEHLFSNINNSLVSLYMALIPMFLGYLLFAFALNFIDASKATLITLIEPLIATLLATFIIGEKFKAIGWLGIALVSLCIFLQSVKLKCKK